MTDLQLKFLPDEYMHYLSTLPSFVWNLILIVGAIVGGLIIRAIIRGMLLLYYRHTRNYFVQSVTKHLHIPAGIFIPFLLVNLVMPFIVLHKKAHAFLDKFIEIGLIISFAFMLTSLIKVVEDFVCHTYKLDKADNLRERKIRTQLAFLRKFIVATIILLTAAAVLLSFENLRKIGAGLLTGVGIGGIVIGFAAQRSLGNLLAGFQIAFTQPIRLDDVLVVEGEFGNVEEITLTYVVLRLWDGRRLILPINYFIEKPFQNWTRKSANILATVYLYLDYTAPVDEIRAEFNRLLQNNSMWDRQVAGLSVTDSKERTLELRALFSATNAGNAFDLRCYVREQLIGYIQREHPGCLPKIRIEGPADANNAGSPSRML